MDDLEITIIPCLCVTSFSKLKGLDGEIDCVECKDHKINVKDCLKSNKLKINQKIIEIESEILNDKKSELLIKEDILKNNYYEIIRKIDLRREEVKLRICKQIDQIAIDLIDQMEKEQNEIGRKMVDLVSDNYSTIDLLENLIDSSLSKSKKEEKTDALLDKIRQHIYKIDSVEKEVEETGKYDLKVKALKINNLDEIFGKVFKKIEKNHKAIRMFAGPGINEALVVLRDGNLAVNSFDTKNFGGIKIIDMENFECIETLQGHNNFVNKLVLLNDGNLASCASDSLIKIWNIKKFECIKTLDGHNGMVKGLTVLNNGNLASSSTDGHIRIWDIESFECVKEISAENVKDYFLSTKTVKGKYTVCFPKKVPEFNNNLYAHKTFKASIHCLVHLPNGNLVSGAYNRLIKIWDMDTFECIKEIDDHKYAVNSLVVLKNGNFASASSDKTVKIWDTTSYECITTLEHTDFVNCLAVLKNGNLASGSNDGIIKMWSMKSFDCIRILEGHTDAINSLAVLSNGNLVSSSDDVMIRIWDMENFECILRFNSSYV